MLGKFTLKDVKIAIDHTSKRYDDKNIYCYKHLKIGYYHPSNANWIYEFCVIYDENNMVYPLDIVVTRFGHIIAKGEF